MGAIRNPGRVDLPLTGARNARSSSKSLSALEGGPQAMNRAPAGRSAGFLPRQRATVSPVSLPSRTASPSLSPSFYISSRFISSVEVTGIIGLELALIQGRVLFACAPRNEYHLFSYLPTPSLRFRSLRYARPDYSPDQTRFTRYQ